MGIKKQTAIRLDEKDHHHVGIVKAQMRAKGMPETSIKTSSAIRFALANQAAKGKK